MQNKVQSKNKIQFKVQISDNTRKDEPGTHHRETLEVNWGNSIDELTQTA